MSFLPAEIIKKKRNGQVLTASEIQDFIQLYTRSEIPDYQMSALLMAIYFRSLNAQETLELTKSMMNSGRTVAFPQINSFKVDKHSTGGVGDKTSLILGPLVAAMGVPVPMISGRGLGHTGGTLDKLESIPGFKTQMSLDQFVRHVAHHNLCFIGQTQDICPADKKIYALRDVTATVESLPLICASIMSKKLAEGIDGLVLDVKFGSGAFMKTKELAEELATNLMSIAKGYNKKVVAVLSNMDQPLGRYAGNSLEVFECLSILRGESFYGPNGTDLYHDTRELSLQLSAYMLLMAGAFPTIESAYSAAKKTLESGSAYQKFLDICAQQGGKIEGLPTPRHRLDIILGKSGYIESMDTEKIGVVGLMIGAGRAKSEDTIDPTAGIEFHYKIGDKISDKDPVFSLYGEKMGLLENAAETLKSCLKLSQSITTKPQLIWKILT